MSDAAASLKDAITQFTTNMAKHAPPAAVLDALQAVRS